ncbi:Rv3235 family protein [Jannaschia sp. R86511]|uniref:Rv3235 family protein n=1 Tax=Jannaschia sp. R86511 TaxID=3093853 RepID=UPI0036D43D65
MTVLTTRTSDPATGVGRARPPALRLRVLPQPQPVAWSPADDAGPTPSPVRRRRATDALDSAGATGQQAFVLHGLPRATADPAFEDPVPTPAGDLPCPDQLARRLVQAAVDVVRGHRPATQLLRWTTPEVYSHLRQRARLEQMTARGGARRPVVRSLRLSPCGERGVEVSAVVLDGPRARAVAARLDGEDSRWRLTALVIG